MRTMKASQPIFLCDAAGCRSTCTLDIDDPEAEKSLRLRGWVIRGDRHYCPPCGMAVVRAEETPHAEAAAGN